MPELVNDYSVLNFEIFSKGRGGCYNFSGMYLEARRGYGGLNHKSAILYFEEIEKLDSYNAWSNGKGIFFHRKIELGIFRNNKRNKETYVIFTEYKGGPHFMGWQEFWVFKVSLEELKDIRNGNIKFFLKYSLAERLKY